MASFLAIPDTTTTKTSRVFDPSQNLIGSGRQAIDDPSELIAYDTLAGISRLRSYTSGPQFSGFVVDECSIVISLDRASCRDVDGDLRSSYSLWFGPGSDLNVAQNAAMHARWGLVPQTNQSAELYAFYEAMFYCLMLEEKGYKIPKVVIMTRSSYLAKGLTEHIYKWELNGWKDNKGRAIKNMAAFERIHQDLVRLSRYCNIDISIWHVEKKHNSAADSLAKEALVESMRKNEREMLRRSAISQHLSPWWSISTMTQLPPPIIVHLENNLVATSSAPFSDNSHVARQRTDIYEQIARATTFTQTPTISQIDHDIIHPSDEGLLTTKKTISHSINTILHHMDQPLNLKIPCFQFWVQKAPHSAPALELAKRLKFSLASKNIISHYLIQMMCAVRRLVVTGEDNAENLEKLFGPQWREENVDNCIDHIWLEARMEVLCFPKPGCIAYVMSERYDATTPRWTPRPPSIEEEEMMRGLWTLSKLMDDPTE